MQLQSDSLLQGGKYRIIRVLGQGGFGITYEAEQVSLGRRVAIKEFFLKDCCERVSDSSEMFVPTQNNRGLVEKFKNKFLREARLIASFNHPNIVRVMDVFEENNTAYYVMDLLPGGSLAEKVKNNGPYSEVTAEKYIRQIARALSYIHSHNTTHLDVKPSNILLNDSGESVLIDFGISKHYDELGEQTTTSSVGYSPGYAPLEQSLLGDVSQFKPSTDIYSLGATLLFLLTGVTPPEASIVNEEGLSKPVSISTRLWNVIERSMKPRQKERFQTIDAFINQLDTEKPILTEDKETTVIVNTPIISDSHKSQSRKWLFVVPVFLFILLFAFLVSKGILLGKLGEPKVSSGMVNGHEWVDLGLSVKWATCNVGASSPNDYGDYFAWGETVPKETYLETNYMFCITPVTDPAKMEGNMVLSKYVCDALHHGDIDHKKRLDYSDDAANATWGGSWRMATISEWNELMKKCKWTWIEEFNRVGYEVESKKNGNRIFLPASGYKSGPLIYSAGETGSYWTSNLRTDFSSQAHEMFFWSNEHIYPSDIDRIRGLSIRPVTK